LNGWSDMRRLTESPLAGSFQSFLRLETSNIADFPEFDSIPWAIESRLVSFQTSNQKCWRQLARGCNCFSTRASCRCYR
jgi:hypothetical protein